VTLVIAAEDGAGLGLLSGIIGAAMGAAATLAVVLLTPLAERRDRYDAALLARRMEAYEQLQHVLEPTSRYHWDDALDRIVIAGELTRWYYDGHGMYMTVALRDLFFELRDGLRTSPDLSRERIASLGSEIRQQMSVDLNSRRRPLLGGSKRD
jgi:hypothetical protein